MAHTLMWPSSLASHRCRGGSSPLVRLSGAEVVASAGEPLGAEVAVAVGETSV
jgi:hypothetical protein